MNDIEKRNDELDKEIEWILRAVTVKRPEKVQRIKALYHELLSEERQRLIGVVEGMTKRMSGLPKDVGTEYAWHAALSDILTTLNKEKD